MKLIDILIIKVQKNYLNQTKKNSENKFKVLNIKYNENISNLRWTVDRINDLKLVKCIVKQIKIRPITMKEYIYMDFFSVFTDSVAKYFFLRFRNLIANNFCNQRIFGK